MNTEVMFSSATDLWATPQAVFDQLNAEFHFNLDPCATPENAKCANYFTIDIDGLSQSWEGIMCFSILRMGTLTQVGEKGYK